MKPLNRIATAVTVATIAFTLVGCSGCDSIKGTYFGTTGNTVLIFESGGECAYIEDCDEDEGVHDSRSSKTARGRCPAPI